MNKIIISVTLALVLFLQLTQSQTISRDSTSSITCEIYHQFNPTEPDSILKDCISQINPKIDTLTELYIFQKNQEIPLEYEAVPVKIEYIKEIADIIPKIKKLEKLEIIFNICQFTVDVEDLESFSNSFKNLENLQYLKLNFANQKLNVQEKNLNLFEKYFDSKKLGNLQELHLNFYSSVIMSNYEKVFQNLTGLKHLQLNLGGQKQVTDTLENQNLNEDSFKNQKQLETLVFEIPNIKNQDFSNLTIAFNGIQSLQKLQVNLNQNVIKVFTSENLNLPQLKSFQYNLYNTEFQGNNFDSFENFLKNLNKLEEFNIDIGYNYYEKILNIIGKSLINNKNLENFKKLEIFAEFNKSNSIYKNLYIAVQKMVNLEKLVLDFKNYVNYRSKNYEFFDEMLLEKSKLHTFILKESFCTNSGNLEDQLENYKIFTKGIQQLENLQTIDIGITTNEVFLQIFENNKKLKNVKLYVWNYLLPDQKNLDVLFKNQNLENLDLVWNFLAFEQEFYPNINKGDSFYDSMEKLLQQQNNSLKILNINFKSQDETKDRQQFNLDFLQEMLKNLSKLNTLGIEINSSKYLIIDLYFLEDTFEKMSELENVSMIVQGEDITLVNIDFMGSAFKNCTKIKDLVVKFIKTKLVDFSPLETAFSTLKNLNSLTLNLRQNCKVKNYDFMINAFQKNTELENLMLDFNLNEGDFNWVLQYAFLNNTKLKKLWLLFQGNYFSCRDALNSMLQPLYDTVTSFQLSNNQADFLYQRCIDLTYLKSQNKRLFFKTCSVLVEDCENFDSPCQNCIQQKGKCEKCLYNFIGGECNECKENSFEDKSIKQCLSCKLVGQNCATCDEQSCLTCEKGFQIKEGENNCTQITDEGDNSGLIIGLSIGGGILLILIVGISVVCVRKRNIKKNQDKLEDMLEESYQESLMD